MTDSDQFCPPALEIQDFLFKQASVVQICEEFPNSPISSSLIAADGKRGLLYIGHENKLIIFKPGTDIRPEWKFEVDLSDRVHRVALSCDCSFLAITCTGCTAFIYDASSVQHHKLDLLHQIRLSNSDGQIFVTQLEWNPAIPDILCTITSDHTIGCFQVSQDKKTSFQIIGQQKAQGLEALCVSWSPKGKQIVIGCKNGDIIQLKPELKVARQLSGPNPSQGVIISILWISNYQFCACYFKYDEQRISVMIVDAPKGVTNPKFTNYEDITFGSGSMDNLCYYLEHVPEWGIVIAASSNSSEVSVLGTYDNGTTWNLWQLMDDSTVQLPLNRKTKTENYPVGIAIDKSSTDKLPWGTDSTLPNPVPVLRVLVTSGQLCCYHMVNLKNGVPALCSPPTEIVADPPIRKPNTSDVSFNFQAGATSTPRSKQVVADNAPVIAEKAKLPTNMFGTSSNSSFSFLAPPANKNSSDIPQTNFKTSGFFNESDGRSGLLHHENKTIKPVQVPQVELQFKQPPVISQQQPGVQPQNISLGLSLKPDIRAESKGVGIPSQVQTESKVVKEPVKELPQYPEEPKPITKEAPVYDDEICLQAYLEEQMKFEKELKNQLELPSWDCGTEEERALIVKKTEEINEFLQELRETTDSLTSDISYLKALLLQSFAWLEESKTKNSTNFSVSGKSLSESNKLADLQRFYYHTQSLLMQASKKLDLDWAEHNNREISRMKIPSPEVIYQTLVRHNQIIMQEKKNIDDLSKKWRAIARGSSNVTSLDRSMASLNLSLNTSFPTNDAAIDLRCQHIAKNTKNFSRDKQMKLRDLLSESAPRIIRVARPTAVQDRLEATLSSLASSKTLQASNKTKLNKITEQQKLDTTKSPVVVTKSKSHNPLSSLDNLVSTIPASTNSFPGLNKSPNSIAPFSTFSSKPPIVEIGPPKSKENITLSFGQQPSASYSINKPKESISFGTPTQKTSEPQISSKVPPTELNIPKFSFTKSTPEISITTTTAKSSGFSFSAAATPPSFTSAPKIDSSSIFKFSTKASPPQAPQTSTGLDFSNLSFGTKSAAGAAPAFSFGKSTSPQQQATPSTSPNKSAVSVALFSSSSPTSGSEKSSSSPTKPSSVAAPASTGSIFGTSTMFSALSTTGSATSSFSFTPVSSPVSATLGASPAMTSSTTSSFGGFSATTTAAPSFGGILSSTSSLSFGTDSSSSTSITPAFGKTGNIFGSTTPTAVSTASTPPIFGGKSSINANATSPSSSSSTTSVVTTTASPTTNKVANTTTTTSVFGNISSTTSAPSLTGEKSPASVSTASETNIFGSKTLTPSTSMFGGSTTSTATGSLIGTSSTPVFGGTSGTQASNVFGASGGASIFGSTSSAPSVFGGTTSIFSSQAAAATTTTSTTSVFGGGAISTTGGSIFGSTASPATAASVFGSTTSPTTAASLFGSTTSTTAGGSLFGSGSTTTTASPSIFGATAGSTTSTPIFGTTSTKPSSVFGGTALTTSASVFGNTAPTTSSSLFGGTAPSTTTASVFGSTAPAASSSIFGGSSLFGASGASPGSLFGSSAVATTTSSTFGSAAAATTTAASLFGSQPGGSTSAPVFGSSSSPSTSGSIFGSVTPQKPTGSIFGAPAGGSMFGGSAVLGSSNPLFGASASPSSAFGQSPSFSSSPTSGFSAFGSPAAFGAAAAPTGFGSPSVLGSASPPAMGSASSNAFNSTFEALGAQSGGLSFGSLAQTPPEPKPQSFQGSSSFSSWR